MTAEQLHDAIFDNDLPAVQRAIAADPALLEARDKYGATPLMRAVGTMDRSLECLQWLLASGADVNARTQQGATVLHYATDASWPTGSGPTPEQIMRLLADAGAPLETRQSYGYTPLMYAVMRGSAAEVQGLLAVGANPNVFFTPESLPVFTRGRTLLAMGTVVELEMTRLLLAAGADVAARDEYGQTALEHAQQSMQESEPGNFRDGVAEYIQILREAGAKG